MGMTKEERAEYMREYAKKNAGYFSEKSYLWQLRHPEQRKAYQKAYREKNREKLNAQMREYAKRRREEHGDEVRAYEREYYYKSKLRRLRDERQNKSNEREQT